MNKIELSAPPTRPDGPGDGPRFVTLAQRRDLDAYFRLRYQVYCVERGFLRAADYPEGCETDGFDPVSHHFGCIDRDGTLVAGVRLVPRTRIGLPADRHCRIEIGFEPWARPAELSRLVFSKAYRQRGGGLAEDARVVLGLYRTVYVTSKRLGVTHLLAAMEPSLSRLLRRFHFTFAAAGPEADYYGKVQPCVTSLAALERSVFLKSPDIYWDFTATLEAPLRPRPWLPATRATPGWYPLPAARPAAPARAV